MSQKLWDNGFYVVIVDDGSGPQYENLFFECSRIRILEHEIETIYIDNNSSHFDAVKDSLRIYKEILKFSASSLIGFLVDHSAYSLLFLLTQNLWLSNIVAKVIRASVNFTLNRKIVFYAQLAHATTRSFQKTNRW